MSLILVQVIFLLVNLKLTENTQLRNLNEQGPNAIITGVVCFKHLAEIYFYNKLPSKIKNMAIFHTTNMTSPASDIEVMFLNKMHKKVMKIFEMTNDQIIEQVMQE